jgi:hypothetical protein
MRWRIGATKVHYVRAEVKPAVIDEGTVVVADTRVVLAGVE